MSDTDSFIDEVTEEVRRDRLFRLMRRYGWIAVLAVLVLVGGAAYNEWRKASERAMAEALGDRILAALSQDDRSARAKALAEIDAPAGGAQGIVDMMAASEDVTEDPAAAAKRLLDLADDAANAQIYRQIATLKAVMIPDSGLTDQVRRERLDGLAMGSGVIRLLAEEQLAYLDIQAGDDEAALTRLQQVAADAGATPGLRRRTTQVIVALGGTPETGAQDG